MEEGQVGRKLVGRWMEENACEVDDQLGGSMEKNAWEWDGG